MSSEELLVNVPVRVSPGAMLQAARELAGLSASDAAERLNWLPEYVDLIERDDFASLRRPVFARGYTRAYGKLVGLDETQLMEAFDQVQPQPVGPRLPYSRPQPLQLQRTGVGIAAGLAVLAVLVLGLWWSQSAGAVTRTVMGG
ncbi:helix-turn-helix domain-containing protein [Kineobactrum sediminis]|nr:helix-turn-helix domain-containing protein [Kineobactrum sediminis]